MPTKKQKSRTKRGRDSQAGFCRRTYKFRVYPRGAAEQIARRWLYKCWFLYCLAWFQRQVAYKYYGKSLSNYDQYKTLIGKKTRPARMDRYELDEVPAMVRQDVLQRLELAYAQFFARLEKVSLEDDPGFPREPEFRHYTSLSLRLTRGLPSGWKIEGERLTINRMGEWKMRIHRPVLGRIKALTLIREVRQWYVCLSCEEVPCELQRLPATGQQIGLYLARPWFGVDSEGNQIAAPQFFQRRAAGIAERQRRYMRRARGSRRRKKAAELHAQYRQTERRQRKDYIENLSLDYLRRYDLIILNQLEIAATVRNTGRRTKTTREVHKEILDNSWGQFVRRLQQKAEQYGKRVVLIKLEKPLRDFVENAKKLRACVGPSEGKSLPDKERHRKLTPPIEGTG